MVMRWRKGWGALMMVLLVTLLSGTVHAQEREYVYQHIDVVLDVQADGTIQVRETQTFAFQGGEEEPFSFATRDIALHRLESISDVYVSTADNRYRRAAQGEEAGTFTIEQHTDQMSVVWYYPPLASGQRTFTVAYTVGGAVRVGEEQDEIWWVGIFPDRDVPVQESSMTINLPEPVARDALEFAWPAARGEIAAEGSQVRIARNEPLPPGEALEVRLRFPADVIDSPSPAWQQQEQDSFSTTNLLCVSFGVIFFIIWRIIWVISTHGESNGNRNHRAGIGGGGGYGGGGGFGGGGGGGGSGGGGGGAG
jgi:uncharacterized membrane protein YgcG